MKTLLDRSLLENKMFTPNYGINNIVNAIKQIIEMMSQISTKDVKIEFRNMIPGIQNIKTDIQRVQQVLINLISNAAKFSKKGEEIFVVLREKMLMDKSNICIEVIDSGLGLSELDQSKLFKPFFQTADTNNRQMNPSGNGLGLSICKNIA